MHPGMIGLHYGQVVFEGMKALLQADGSIAVFRPRENARRFQRSARRLAMPEVPERDVHAGDRGGGGRRRPTTLRDDRDVSLYLRPLLYASEPNLMLRPAHEYTFMLMAFVAGGFFGTAVSRYGCW